MSTDSFDSFGFDDVDPDRPGSGGGGKLPEGGYKFTVTEVIVQNDKGSTQIECEVVDAKDLALVGRKHFEYLSWPDGNHSQDYNRIKKEQLLAWCYAGKTTSAEEIQTRKKTGHGFDKAWLEALVGRSVLGFVKVETYKANDGSDKTSAKCEGRVWSLDNPKGKGIPGWIGPAGDAGGQGSPVPKPSPSPAPTTTQAPAVDPFVGLV